MNEVLAAKRLSSQNNKSQYKRMINREIGIMSRCVHPTIIKFYGYSFEDFYDCKNVTIFIDLTKQGSLEDFLQKVKSGLSNVLYNNTSRQIILVGIARGMMYLHQHKIIHRDLKPGNVLLDDDLHPLLTDFGLAKLYDDAISMSQTQQCGTSMYIAPEVIEGEKYSGKADVILVWNINV